MILYNEEQVDGGNTPAVVAPKPTAPIISKPVVPKAAPAKVLDSTFSDDFTGTISDIPVEQLPEHTATKPGEKVTPLKTTNTVPPEVKAVEAEVVPKVEETPKVETEPVINRVLKAPASEQKPVVAGKEVIKPITPGARDYSGFSAQEAAALKQMGNEGFELASRVLKENKELKRLEGSSYLQHEQAYTLDPHYQAINNDSQLAMQEAQYWREQLVNMDAGKPWKPIVGYDQQGRLVYGAEKQPSKADEEQVRLAMNQAYQVSQQYRAKLSEYPQAYKQRVQQDLVAINSERANRFEWVKNPKLLDYTVEIEGLGERSLKQIKQDFVGLFPPYLRNHPAIEVCGDLMIALRVQAAELAELKNGKAVETIKKEEQQHIEPSSKEKPVADNKVKVHGVSEFSIDPELGV